MIMEKKTTLITGAAGFLGSHLCDRFIREGHHVIAMDNLITGDVKNIEHHFSNEVYCRGAAKPSRCPMSRAELRLRTERVHYRMVS